MIIKFKNIHMINFLSFQDAFINLENCNYILISGRNDNFEDSAISNGAGKSTTFDALSWCLTGETIRGTKDIVNKFSNGGAKVELNFEIDNINYKIIRTKEDKELGTNLKLYIDNEDKSGKGIRDTEKILNEYLPDLTSQLIGSVIILGQGLPQRFTNNTPSGRKEILEKLSKSDFMISDIKDKLTSRKLILNQNLRQLEDNILVKTSKKTILESQLQKLINEKQNLIYEDFDTLINNKQIKLDTLNKEFNNLQFQLEKIHLKLQLCDSKLSNLYKDEEAKKIKIIQENNNIINPLFQELTKFQTERKSINEQILKFESVKDVCPTCGQKLPNIHKIDTTNLHSELDTLDEKIKLKKIDIDNLKELADNKINELEKEIDVKEKEINEEKSNINKEQSSINIYEISDNIHKLEIEINTIKLNKENYEVKSKTIDSDINNVQNQLNKFNEEILYDNIDKDKINSHIDIINKMINIVSRDFRVFLLSSCIEFIENRAKQYSLDIFNTDNIMFNLDGNNINITYKDKQYENLSGGERQKIDLIIQFSIKDMLNKYLNFSSNILVLDEIFDNLDSLSCQKIINLISTKLTDIESIFIITHHTDISIPYDNEITIVKGEDNISRVE